MRTANWGKPSGKNRRFFQAGDAPNFWKYISAQNDLQPFKFYCRLFSCVRVDKGADFMYSSTVI